ncbi:MAG: MFS transporter [Clostridia bacterium]|nr:MFS transporter [Clostridia bacterium]
MEPKLNNKRVMCVGFAFFLICAFWQAYDNTIPMILTNKFGMNQTWSGLIMALDNILALFMLPLFGTLSDRTKTRLGRRTPYILAGTIVAVIAFIGLSFTDALQLKQLGTAARVDDPDALAVIYRSEQSEQLTSPEGDRFVLSERYTENEFIAIRSRTVSEDGSEITNPEYTQVVVPARQSYAHHVTEQNSSILTMFIALLLLTLIAMATFRSPAVALMPDVTLKPLRSKANAIINLMGTAGGILVLILGMVFKTSALENAMMGYTAFFCVVGGLMLLALLVFMLTVREPKLVEEMQRDSRKYGYIEDEGDNSGSIGGKKLGKEERRSMLFILASIVLWFMGYNAVTSKYSVYATTLLHKNYNLTLIIAQAAAIVSYIPVGIIASKAGRKKTILAGIVMLGTAFGVAAFMRADSPTLVMNIMFALAGIGWATINVNSFPMVVEMCSEADVGRYTGIYYTASMSAQIITPIFSGMIMDRFGLAMMFPYAVLFVILAFITMLFVKHGDSKPEARTDLTVLEDIAD